MSNELRFMPGDVSPGVSVASLTTITPVTPGDKRVETPDADALPTFLPGRLTWHVGRRSEYLQLAGFHYLDRPPATFLRIHTIRYVGRDDPRTACLAAIGVLSYPTARSRGRERYFDPPEPDAACADAVTYARRVRFANAYVRTISRVVVHPRFRSLGLATRLVRRLIDDGPTRFVEASARLGRATDCFVRGGMTPVTPTYFVIDKRPDEPFPTHQTPAGVSRRRSHVRNPEAPPR